MYEQLSAILAFLHPRLESSLHIKYHMRLKQARLAFYGLSHVPLVSYERSWI